MPLSMSQARDEGYDERTDDELRIIAEDRICSEFRAEIEELEEDLEDAATEAERDELSRKLAHLQAELRSAEEDAIDSAYEDPYGWAPAIDR